MKKLEPFVPATSAPSPRPTKQQVEIAFRWMTGKIRLRSAHEAIGYEGTRSNSMRYLQNIFMRGVRLGMIKVKLV